MPASENMLRTEEGRAGGMRAAVDAARHGILAGQAPFGAAIFTEQGELIVAEHNQVRKMLDPTAHAEVFAIRLACRLIDQRTLSGCWLFTTCEPCPMCAAAAVFAGLRHVAYGASVEDAQEAGFSELQLPSRQIFDRSGDEIAVYPGVLRQECRALFDLPK
ncbi:tRNA-specific adenosine deaminase [Rhodopirellula sp. SM50]|nr:nucleoside deaminase [Rhodopirellula sp. SM50]PAY20791.1 tRNA-specific adenosine deaminase [Rhodopirellula sp. SM50]